MNKILHVFKNADLRCMHDGLAQVAKKNKINVQKLQPGEFVFFLNSACNRLKIYCARNLICYLKHPLNHRIDLNVIKFLPSTFNGQEFDIDKAFEKSFAERAK